jgi:DNA-binding helix-hairpin-helix protein with protein kinase domain
LLAGKPDQAVKLYRDDLRREREPKVRAMIEATLASSTDLVAFPIEAVTDQSGRFLGFAMRLVKGYSPLHELYSPKSRKAHFPKANYRFLVRAALNVARAVGKVHQSGCVIGDFNHSGVLVSNDATVALIDADSFQFTLNGRAFPCVVGVVDFTPPELHGVDLSKALRTREHDHFGLAVAIFHLLSMGRHPYAGKFAGPDLSMSEAIEQHRFAYSLSRQSETRTAPPPGTITLADFPASTVQGFEAAFGLMPSARPSAEEWISLLGELETRLSKCSRIKTHYFASAAGGCVWCRLAGQSGVDMFPDVLGVSIPTPPGARFDLEGLWARASAIVLPAPADLIPPAPNLGSAPNPAIAAAKRATDLLKAGWFGLIALAAIAFVYAPGAAIIWICAIGFGSYRLFATSADNSGLLSAYSLADRHASQAELAFLSRIGLVELHNVRSDLEAWVSDYRELDNSLNIELARLRLTREARQRDAYLDRYRIRDARIPGIGQAKAATLSSFGIETAADVNSGAVHNVPGFGDVLTAVLVDWRRDLERRFRYNPAPDASDIQAEQTVRSTSAAKRNDLQAKIRSAADALQSGPATILSRRAMALRDQALQTQILFRATSRHDPQHFVL